MPYLTPANTNSPPFTTPAGSYKAGIAMVIPPQFDEETEDPPRIPTVSLDVDAIVDEMAARMAVSLLGHVLFLKGQIPFPVGQLPRLRGKSNPRAMKLRLAFMDAFDVLTSHFDSSFSALSTAFARYGSTESTPLSELRKPKRPRRAYLALLVGPSVGTAKAKVILGLDGLQTKVWGLRDDEEDDDDDEEGEEQADGDDDDSAEEPDESESEEEDDDEDEGDENEGHPPAPASPPPSYAHSQTQQVLQKADRLLSRALAGSDALSTELAPTQTHILMRAPRRFSHPAWLPQQNVTGALENTLSEFLVESGVSPAPTDTKKKPKKGSKVEGVWVAARTGLTPDYVEPSGGTEDDDMIWYAWDGKLVGFSDW
ncbi:hypothetical protein BD626DRAFT_394119 [Schizophyllum amplum]|uniref:Uncharacterized protein n=1 Tax=Schizophyllum amplum TaxID=97359 RepID=A0A550CV93_9AGAR|nr:hypothetical protein BD626DRAFT_394119 [Auriculariopsis ampla]